jgi:hypothetical protein
VDAPRDDIRHGLDAAVAGQAVLDQGVRATRAGPLPEGLTEREAEVLAHVAAGLSNTESVQQLFVAERRWRRMSTGSSPRPRVVTAPRLLSTGAEVGSATDPTEPVSSFCGSHPSAGAVRSPSEKAGPSAPPSSPVSWER